MTGFGKATCEVLGKTISVEIRSLNSKTLDLSVKLPFAFRDKEQVVRSAMSPLLVRGKVECMITIEEGDDAACFTINKDAVNKYYHELEVLVDKLKISKESLMTSVLKFPDVIKKDHIELGESDWKTVDKTLHSAYEKYDQFRVDEGLALKKDLIKRITNILLYLKKVDPLEKKRLENVRTRLLKGIEGSIADNKIDQNRFEQEIIYYLEKLDISEEKTRLKKHCDYFLETVNEEATGKKLGFISQEIGREINTLGSKANDAAIQKIVVQMKDELEKIKEQVLNVL